MTQSQSTVPSQLVTFKTCEYTFGLDVLEVQEVLRHQQMTSVPLATAAIQGLMNLRGQIVAAIGMRQRLMLPDAGDPTQQMNLIVSLKDGVASLVVDSVGDVITIDPTLYRPKPSTLKGPLREMVCGVYQLERTLLLHLDPESACNVCDDEEVEDA